MDHLEPAPLRSPDASRRSKHISVTVVLLLERPCLLLTAQLFAKSRWGDDAPRCREPVEAVPGQGGFVGASHVDADRPALPWVTTIGGWIGVWSGELCQARVGVAVVASEHVIDVHAGSEADLLLDGVDDQERMPARRDLGVQSTKCDGRAGQPCPVPLVLARVELPSEAVPEQPDVADPGLGVALAPLPPLLFGDRGVLHLIRDCLPLGSTSRTSGRAPSSVSFVSG